ncbi:hypothetical protein THAOC_10791 [Thalassiosira oceanica]|uniref:tRNA/rRNA methyltransferase SpoU type domain-containing protein n=1 Tax=Thalassiosira oceanica TaxID=159749 RepID=K0T3Y1_THAOC|nr:hypothetical protein THAOC_10791 [Thalassiosira oceanica]|eukprot:EJK68071.1 hypothetical protein THAOC_10791 [Thalassiosira oceanica]
MEGLRARGFKTTAMALADDSYPIDAPELREIDKLAIVLGSEGDGLRDETVAACDYTVKIPMFHDVDSLNVAAASADNTKPGANGGDSFSDGTCDWTYIVRLVRSSPCDCSLRVTSKVDKTAANDEEWRRGGDGAEDSARDPHEQGKRVKAAVSNDEEEETEPETQLEALMNRGNDIRMLRQLALANDEELRRQPALDESDSGEEKKDSDDIFDDRIHTLETGERVLDSTYLDHWRYHETRSTSTPSAWTSAADETRQGGAAPTSWWSRASARRVVRLGRGPSPRSPSPARARERRSVE